MNSQPTNGREGGKLDKEIMHIGTLHIHHFIIPWGVHISRRGIIPVVLGANWCSMESMLLQQVPTVGG